MELPFYKGWLENIKFMSDPWIYIDIFLKKEIIRNFSEVNNTNKPSTIQVSFVVHYPKIIIINVRMLIAKYSILERYTLTSSLSQEIYRNNLK